MEKLVVNQLDGVVSVPAHLDFECGDRSTLLDQLKILQMVLKKERDKNGGKTPVVVADVKKAEDKRNSIQNVPQFKNSIPQDLKDKIDKNKRIAVERREAKLRELDKKAISLSKPSTSNHDDTPAPSADGKDDETWSKLADRMKKQRLENKDDTATTVVGSKRSSDDSNHVIESAKRFKNDQNRGSGSREPDLMTASANSSTSASREEIRLKVIEKIRNSGMKMSIVEPGEFALKYALSAPYHIFLTRVEDQKETHDQQFSLTFPEILDRSLGEIVSSLQINFMLDAGWLCAQYLLAGQSSDMLILYGEREDQEKLPRNIKTIHMKMAAFGCHHSKLMVLRYKDNGIRVVVSTANLYSDDWENRTQG